MRRTLLVTNDFPPRPGGIQAYLHALAARLRADDLVVYTSSWRGKGARSDEFDARQPFRVVRDPTSVLLPTPSTRRTAVDLMHRHELDAVWFGAAAPLGMLAPAVRRAGAERVVASTHGHEVGWSMLPGARSVLRRIGADSDVVTYVSQYTRGRFAAAFGPLAGLEHLPSGVDPDVFAPDAQARAQIRARYGLGDRPTVVCVSRLVPRKGQDALIRALPSIRARVRDAALLIVGGGPYRDRLTALAEACGVGADVTFTGSVPWPELPAHYAAGDVFAMPARTRGNGLDVEGLGIVYLEASATGLPVVAGRSGGAPETVLDEVTGHVVDGRDDEQLTDTIASLLADPTRAARMGAAGRSWVSTHWRWDLLADRLATLLTGGPAYDRAA